MSEEKLVRGISRWDLTAIVINTVIGAGIFGLPSKVAALIGSYSLLAFVLCAVIIFLIVLCFAEVASRFKTTGGAYLYAKSAFGSLVGFEVGWLFWLTRITASATNCNLLIDYLGFFSTDISQGWMRIPLIAIIVLGVMTINLVGIRESATATNILTVGKLVPLFLLIVIGVFFLQPGNFNFSNAPELDVFAGAVLVLIYAFVGFESAVVPAGEMREPQKNTPFALFTAISVIVAIYILIQIVCIGTLPELANSNRPLADAAQSFVGTYGASVIVIGAVISILGNLNVGLLAASRLPFAMAENKELPAFLAKTHERFKTPFSAIIITSVSIFIFTVQSSFISALKISTITRLFVYAVTCAALPVLRRRKNTSDASFSAPFGVSASALALILIGWLLWNVDFKEEGFKVLVVTIIGLILYYAYRAFVKTKNGA
jgi:basic amino acid/polyamine antiporter, APA family